MPRMESGMVLVYDSGGGLTKIRNADGSLYYFPSDEAPEEYQGATGFIWEDNYGYDHTKVLRIILTPPPVCRTSAHGLISIQK
jgi:hypothetical protein